MSTYYLIRVIDGRFQVGATTDGIDFAPLPRAAFGTPREAIRYADMRQQNTSPLRSSVEGSTAPPSVQPSAERLTALSSGDSPNG